MKRTNSETLFKMATRIIPGGVNSPVRSFGSVGGNPLYIVKGKGSKITDADGNEFVDFCGSWGPLILGHAHPEVVDAVARTAANGLTFGACCPLEVELAELLTKADPNLEMVRMVSSGTEAVMTAIRLARGFTGRSKILKFDGCYHGHADHLLVAAGSGLLTEGISSSAGVTARNAADTIVVPYNDIDSVSHAISSIGAELAAIIVEPVAGNMGLVKPKQGFLEGLRKAADSCGALLIFDEVITGFRLGPTTYGRIVGGKPDLTTLGKIIGGGMPLGCVGGRAEIMRHLAPLGKVYQAGTLSGNPVALSAGIATLRILLRDNPYQRLAETARGIADAVNATAASSGGSFQCLNEGGMFTIYFTNKKPIENLIDVKSCDTVRFGRFFNTMIEKGFYLSPSQFEVDFVSAAHSAEEIGRFIDAVRFLEN